MIAPYGTAIQEAVASGDLQRMKDVAQATEAYLRDYGNVPAALEALRAEIAKQEAKN